MNPPTVKPSWPYWLMCVLLALGAVGGFLGVLIPGILDLGKGMIDVDVPGETTLQLEAAGTYTVFRTSTVPGSGPVNLSDVHCTLTRRGDGSNVPLTVPSTSQTYTYNNQSGASFLEFTIDVPGEYALVTESSQPSMLVIAHDFVGRLFRLIVRSVLVLGGLGLLALFMLILAIVRVVRNSRARAALAAAAANPSIYAPPRA